MATKTTKTATAQPIPLGEEVGSPTITNATTTDSTALPALVVEQINALIDAKIAQKVSETTRVLIGTAQAEFERLYMRDEPACLTTATFRRFLRWCEATLNTRVAALLAQYNIANSNPQP